MPKIYACSDLHGHLDIWKKIKSIVSAEDKIIIIGDCIDRGPDSWELLKTITEDPQAILLLGNHEYMLANAMSEFLRKKHGRETELYFLNHGEPTFDSWKEQDNADPSWIDYLRDLPVYSEYTNTCGRRLLLTHSGYADIDDFYHREAFVWDREHITESFFSNRFDIVIHGHTPIPHLREYIIKYGRSPDDIPRWNGNAFWYSNNHKCDIDACTVISKTAILIDLDSLESWIIRA